MYRLRYHAFIERQGYNVSSIRNMEYDSYDTPAAVYLVWREEIGKIGGCTRITPTDRPYMIEQLWPDLVGNEGLPHAHNIWEASRFCIDKGLPKEKRRQIHIALLCAMQEFCIAQNIEFMIGVMQPRIWLRIFISLGWPIEYLGSIKQLANREEIVAGRMPISFEILHRLRSQSNLPAPAIRNPLQHPLLQVVYDESLSYQI
jgi:acyl homoserine lactone synthase